MKLKKYNMRATEQTLFYNTIFSWPLQKNLTYCILSFLLYSGCTSEKKETNVAPLIERRVAGMLFSAEEAMTARKYGKVLAMCDSIIVRRRDIPYCYFIKARALTEVKRFQDARDAFTRVLQLDPNYPSVWFRLGNNAYHREQYREALTFYAREWERVNSSGSKKEKCAILIQMGRARKHLGEIDEAILAFEEVLKLNESHKEVYNDLGHIYNENGELIKALEYQRRALKLNPDEGQYHYYVGALLYQLGEMEKAIPYLTTAVSMIPWHHGAHYNLGRALIATGRLDQGRIHMAVVDSLQQKAYDIGLARFSAQTYPDRPVLWISYGNLLYVSGLYDEALKAYLVAHYLEPENKNIERVINSLKGLIAAR